MSNLLTSWHCKEAVTAISEAGDWLFAGKVSGEIAAFNLKNYQQGPSAQCHSSAVLVLLVRDGYLISGSADSLVKIWTINDGNLTLVNTAYCIQDVGDIFCVEYINDTVYLGTQNASIHWYNLKAANEAVEPAEHADLQGDPRPRGSSHVSLHPAIRPNRFFDSCGPGGRLAPQQHNKKHIVDLVHDDSTLNEVGAENVVNFAHNGYVYAMVSTHIDSGDILVTGSSDGTIKAWSVESGLTHLWTLPIGDSVLGMCLFKSWQLYCSLESGDMAVIDLETQEMVKRSIQPGLPLLTLSIVNSTAYIAGGKTILRYDPITKVSLEWDASDEITATIALRSRPSALVTTSLDGSISVWNVNDTQLSSKKNSHHIAQKVLKDSLNEDNMIEVLSHLISHRSVSRQDRKFWTESRDCATLLRDICRELGGESDLLKVENGNPIVYARFRPREQAATGASAVARVLFYGHYDVIDANEKNWSTPPFELVSGNGFLYGRGTSDNKGPVVAALYAVGQLLASNTLKNDVSFLIEGEEERGSFGFETTVKSHMDRIGHTFDWIVFSNSYWIDDKRPCLNYGLRGVVFFDLEVKNDKSDVHSGVDGGVFREPALDMVHLLSSLTNGSDNNEIMIPGFKDNVVPITSQEMAHYDEIINSNSSFSKYDLISRWRTPTLTVHSMNVSGPGDASVIPSSVTARISLRIVPNQTTDEITLKTRKFVEASFKALGTTNNLEVKCAYGAEPWLGDVGNEPYGIMRQALKKEWGMEPLFIREGGSIPVARGLEKLFGAPAAQLPCGQSSDGAHLKNERLRVTNLIAARNVFKELFGGVGPRH